MVLQLSVVVGHESEQEEKAYGSGSWLEQEQVGDGKIVVVVVGIAVHGTAVEELVVERMKLGLLVWRPVEVVEEQRSEFERVVQRRLLLLVLIRIGLFEQMQHLVLGVLEDGKSHRHSQQCTGLVAVGRVLVVAWVEQ